MSATSRPVNSRCQTCQRVVLWALLPSGTSVPLDQSDAGPIQLDRSDQLRAVWLSAAELAAVFERQRLAREAGDQPEQLYRLHPEACRKAAAIASKNNRRRRRPRKGARR